MSGEQEFWTGPYGVKVHKDVQSVVASDGYNHHDKYGGITEIMKVGCGSLTESEYKAWYCLKGKDGNFYHKDRLTLNIELDDTESCECAIF